MKGTIYYYKTISGKFHFSTGVIRSEDRAPQYLMMLRHVKYPLQPLYLDNEEDFKTIRDLFNIPLTKTWQDVYYEI